MNRSNSRPAKPLSARMTWPSRTRGWSWRSNALCDFISPEFRVGLSPNDRHALRGADQIQAEAPEIARMRGAEPVVGGSCELGALDRFAAGATPGGPGVESSSRRTSCQDSVSLARAVITTLSSVPAALNSLL